MSCLRPLAVIIDEGYPVTFSVYEIENRGYKFRQYHLSLPAALLDHSAPINLNESEASILEPDAAGKTTGWRKQVNLKLPVRDGQAPPFHVIGSPGAHAFLTKSALTAETEAGVLSLPLEGHKCPNALEK